jgi:hypothetical protein
VSFKNRWVEPSSQSGRILYRQLRSELRSSRTSKARREAIVALLDGLAKNPNPAKPRGLTNEVRELYAKLGATDVLDAMGHYYALSATEQEDLQSSAGLSGGQFQAWLTAQFWLMKQGQPNALDGGKHGEPTLA